MEDSTNSNYTILVVDDDVALTQFFREALLGVGFNVLTSSSGLKSLNMIRYGGAKVDVVLLDYGMPTLDGGQTLEHLKVQFPNVKTIGVTGIDTAQLSEIYLKGVEKLLPKPVTVGELVGSIHSVLGVEVESEGKVKVAERKTNWVRSSLSCVLLLVSGYGLLQVIYDLVNQALFAR